MASTPSPSNKASTTSPSSSSSSNATASAAPRYRGAWAPVLHDPHPLASASWSYEVRNASNVLNGLTDNIRVHPQKITPKKSSKPLTSATTSTSTSTSSSTQESKTILETLPSVIEEPKQTAADTTNNDKNSNVGDNATVVPAQVSATTVTNDVPKVEVKDEKKEAKLPPIAPAKNIEASEKSNANNNTDIDKVAAAAAALTVDHHHDDHDDHAHHDVKVEDHKVEEHNKSITQLATTLVEYEMTHGEVEAANKRVIEIMNQYKGVLSEQEIVDHIIKAKCIQAALVGLIIGGCATIPGLGSIAAIIIGAAADGALTTKLQVDMMLEIGCALGHYEKLKDKKYRKERLLLSAGLIKHGVDADGKDIFIDTATNDPFTTEAGHRVSEKAIEEFGKRSFLYFIPVVGAVSASATDLSWTYVIGRRAETVFRTGEKDLPPW